MNKTNNCRLTKPKQTSGEADTAITHHTSHIQPILLQQHQRIRMKIIEGVRKGAAKITKTTSRRSMVVDPASELFQPLRNVPSEEFTLDTSMSPKKSSSFKRRSGASAATSSSSADKKRSKSREKKKKERSSTSSATTATSSSTRASTHQKSSAGRRSALHKSMSVSHIEDRQIRERLAEEIHREANADACTGNTNSHKDRTRRRKSPDKLKDKISSHNHKDSTPRRSRHSKERRSSSRRDKDRDKHSRMSKMLAKIDDKEQHLDTQHAMPALSTPSAALASASASAAAAAASAATAAALAASLIPSEDARISFETPDPQRLAKIADIVAVASQAAAEAAAAAQELVTMLTSTTARDESEAATEHTEDRFLLQQ